MNKDNIVDVLNSLLVKQRGNSKIDGHFVLQRNKETAEIKAYKIFSATLWYVQQKKTYKTANVSISDIVIEGQEGPIINDLNTKLLFEIFNMYGSERWYKIVKGDINGLLEYE